VAEVLAPLHPDQEPDAEGQDQQQVDGQGQSPLRPAQQLDHRDALAGLLAQVGAQERPTLVRATLRTQARGLSRPPTRAQSR